MKAKASCNRHKAKDSAASKIYRKIVRTSILSFFVRVTGIDLSSFSIAVEISSSFFELTESVAPPSISAFRSKPVPIIRSLFLYPLGQGLHQNRYPDVRLAL